MPPARKALRDKAFPRILLRDEYLQKSTALRNLLRRFVRRADRKSVVSGKSVSSSAAAPVQTRDSSEKKNLAAEMLALFREMNAALAGVSDKASADAAAPKIREIEAAGERIASERGDAFRAFTLDDVKAL